jgi:hypothetical protein
LNFFFSDELSFGVRGWLWNRYFASEFQRRKGYDVVPELASLFEETGPRAVKIRLDYSDVMVALSEENYFRPVYEWHNSRGMLYGCDHGGRGRDVTEFGDYFRTQRWMSGPGNDQPRLAADIVKNKVASSIAHLYERPRTWLEGFYGSGWGTTSAQIVDATWRNFAQGHNLLTLHGVYYSTRGGWWEWAPPCNHFRMPYWTHMGEFLRAVERMSYLLSQGRHRADVAVLYPVAAVEAGLNGKESVEVSFGLGRRLYDEGIDFDYMDFESLARAKVEDGKLKVAGEEYRVLALPAMRAARHSTIEKAVEFRRAGGIVAVLGEAPRASERMGDGDPQVLAMAKELGGGQSVDETVASVGAAFPRDVVCKASKQPSVLHRKAGTRDIYFLYGVEKGAECSFRATGRVDLWDPWSGGTSDLGVEEQARDVTRLRMPLEQTEAQVIVFSPGRPQRATSEKESEPEKVALDGDWEFELAPMLDNRFGDYRLPVTKTLLGAEARRFRYAEDVGEEGSDPNLEDSTWRQTTYTYGPRFWKLGPLPSGIDSAGLEQRLAAGVDPLVPVEIGGKQYRWSTYEFSLRWGVENDPGHQGYHGLKAEVSNDFIALGKMQTKSTTTAYVEEEGGSRYYLWTSAAVPGSTRARVVAGGELAPGAVWIGGVPVAVGGVVSLRAGGNAVLLRYDRPGRGYFALMDAGAPNAWRQTVPLASIWYNRPGLLVYDTRPDAGSPVGWYRTTAPPGLRGLKIVARGRASVWVDGRAVALDAGRRRDDGSQEYRVALGRPVAGPVTVAIRVEQERGSYAGAAFPEPVEFECGAGMLAAGDWSRIEGLSSYSGGAWYRKDVELTGVQAGGPVLLDLGSVSASAEVHVNGKKAGVKLAPPYRVDISRFVSAGRNRIEVLVYSALSNHYQTIPTRYRGGGPSGLLGPVVLLLNR